MNKKLNIFLLLTLFLCTTLIFSACGSDDDGSSSGIESEYKTEVIFEGQDIDRYHKSVVIGGGAFNSIETDLINDETGKVLPSYSIDEDEYTFKAYNRFAISKKVEFYSIFVTARAPLYSDPINPMKIVVKVYKDGKLIETIEDTASENPRKDVKINRDYYYKDF